MKILRTILCSLCFLSPVVVAGEYPAIVDPFVTATPPGAKVSAGYLSLTNNSDTPVTITDAFSPTGIKVEIHLSSVVDDVAKMEKQDSVLIEPGATVNFEHGGYHLMLMELTEPLKENTSVDIILVTSVGDMLIEMPVQKLSARANKHDHNAMAKETDDKEAAHMKHGDGDAETMDHNAMQQDENTVKPDKVVH